MHGFRVIALVSNPFSHDPRVRREAVALRDAGFDVHVVGFDAEGTFPKKEDFDGIAIHRLRPSKILKVPGSAFLTRPAWWLQARRLVTRLMTRKTIIHCHDFDTLPIGVGLRKQAHAVVFDAHEIWIEMAAGHFSPWMQTRMRNWEKRMVRKTDRVVTVNEPLHDYYAEIHDVAPLVVMNCKEVDSEWSAPVEQQFTVVYLGTMSEMRQVHLLVEAVRDLADVRLVIAGGGDLNYIAKIKAMCSLLSNAEYLGVLPEEQVLDWTRRAHLVALPIDPGNENQRKALANKQFEAMAVGRPIVVSDDCYSADFVREHGVGVVASHSVEGFRGAIESMRKDPDEYQRICHHAHNLALREFSWDAQADKLVRCFRELCGSGEA